MNKIVLDAGIERMVRIPQHAHLYLDFSRLRSRTPPTAHLLYPPPCLTITN